MRAEEHRVNAATAALHHGVHAGVNPVKRCEVEESARQACLVGGNDNTPAGLIEKGDGFQTARNRYPLFGAADVAFGVMVDDTVAVKNHDSGTWVHRIQAR